MKRNLSSDMDSDCDDLFEDSSSKGTPTPSSDSCQLVNRKRRRGIIEKRRRDRINHSLSELRRLVPAAFEKQGSAKLEKAEILQMTVDHLKMLHAKGFDALTFDPHKFAMDYHNIGFRECASEVARYMVAIEGMDLQDPLRLRLMSHLQCYSAQRELAMKTSSVHSSPWSPASSTSVPNPVGPPTGPPAPSIHHQYSHNPTGHVHPHHGSGSLDIGPPPSSLSHASYNCSESRLHHPGDGLASLNNNNPNNGGSHFTRMGSNNPQSVAPTSVPHTFATSGGGVSSQMMPSIGQMPGNQYLTGHGFGAGPYANHHHQGSQGSSVKPYRPWGAELAY